MPPAITSPARTIFVVHERGKHWLIFASSSAEHSAFQNNTAGHAMEQNELRSTTHERGMRPYIGSRPRANCPPGDRAYNLP
jgi:hypothetical protein